MPYRRRFVAILIALAALPAAHAVDAPDTVPVGRYTTVDTLAEAVVDPLAVVAQLRFPRETVHNVGDAVRYLLHRTGYSVRADDDYSTRLFDLPLPESQRQLGPGRVSTLAQALVGQRYRLCVDRYNRQLLVQAETAAGCPAVNPTPLETSK